MLISVDIEADGKIPGRNSMLSLGAVAFDLDRNVYGKFSVNLKELEGAAPDEDTAAWWKTQPEAWKACRENIVEPSVAMHMWLDWLRKFDKPTFVGYPATYDFMFAYWYLVKFTDTSPFSFSGLDIKTYAAAVLDMPYRQATKRNYPKEWFGTEKHNHVAVDDAYEQAMLLCSMVDYRKNK